MEENAKAWALSLNGKTIGGRYRLGKPIGIGGMGAVFEGQHQAVGRSVAVKILFPELSQNADTVRRFQREARAAAAIARRGVVDILDFDVDPSVGPYLVMEHLQGDSLLSRIKSTGRLDPYSAFSIGAQIADTLAAVHEREIVHRDLKPANVFLAKNEEAGEEVKLLDFGISRVAPAPGKAPLTVPGTVLGTPRYMAPEQAACEPDVDHRVDIYATGLILYYALSGVKPFAEVPRGSLLIAVIRDGPTPLRHLHAGLPEGVYAIVEQAMERDRERRFQSAVALGRSIEAVLKSLPPPRKRPSLTTDDDFEPTAIDSRPDSTLKAAQPLAAPPTTRSNRPPHLEVEDPSEAGSATISEIPSRRLKTKVDSGLKPHHQDVGGPTSDAPPSAPQALPPDTVDVVHQQGAPPHVLSHESSGSWHDHSEGPSFDAAVNTQKEGASLAGRNLRESAGWTPYATTPSSSSFEADMDRAASPRPPGGQPHRSGAPPTLDVTGGLPVVAPRPVERPQSSPRTSAVAPPTSSSAPPRRRRRWILALVIGVVALLVGAGGLVIGLHLWDTFRALQGQ